jgi:hypothetical protein
MTELRRCTFTLGFAISSLNVTLRQHFAERGRDQKMLYFSVLEAAHWPRVLPRPAFAKARVTVTRISPRTLDRDNLFGAAKALVDILKPRSERNPLGVGLLIEDSPDRCELHVEQEIGDAATRVLIEELEYVAPPPKPKRTSKPRRYGPKKASAAAVRANRKRYGLV